MKSGGIILAIGMEIVCSASARGCAFALHHIRRATPTSKDLSMNPVSSMSSLLSSLSGRSTPEHTPSQFVVDDAGLKWRLCAGVAIFNSKNEILIGERIGKPGSWQTPQGGVDGGDKPESVTDAAIRELYEEVGLEHGKHVLIQDLDEIGSIKCQYKTEGTGSWLEKEGFAGQELNWVIFRCADSDLEKDPSLVCKLSGLNGEKPEFSAVRWERLDWVVENVWEKKARPYQVLQDAFATITKSWADRCAERINLSGRWSRDSSRGVDVVEGLVARGLSEEKAAEEAEKPYIQSWKKDPSNPREWTVTTYDVDGVKSRRELHYPLGEFDEVYEGSSLLFGGTDGGVVNRRCYYLAEEDADEQIAHCTVSETPRGREESLRYIKDGDLILRRSFVHSWRSVSVQSTEVFARC